MYLYSIKFPNLDRPAIWPFFLLEIENKEVDWRRYYILR